MGIKSQFKPLSKIWNSCIDDLKKLGTLSRTGVETDAVKQWEALPDALRAGVDHPRTEELCRLVESHTDEHGHAIVGVDALGATLTPEEAQKLTLGRSRRLAQMAEQIGYCLEPDPRLTGRTYHRGEQINAFLKMSTAPVNPARYGPAACMLQFGYLVATSDGKADGKEMEVISRHIESAFELQEDEVRRMDRLRALLDKTGPEKPLLRRLIRGLSKEQRQTIAKLLVAIVLTDGVVTAAERRAIKGACTLLAIDFSAIESLLPAGMSDDPVTVVPGSTGVSGEQIPGAPEHAFVLDRNAIASIMADTHEVAQMLAKVMSDPEEPEGEPEHEVPSKASVAPVAAQKTPQETLLPPDSPPAKYAPIHVALLAQDKWPLSEAEALARKSGMMLSGVIDALNEWSSDALGGLLYYQDGDCITVDRSLLLNREG